MTKITLKATIKKIVRDGKGASATIEFPASYAAEMPQRCR